MNYAVVQDMFRTLYEKGFLIEQTTLGAIAPATGAGRGGTRGTSVSTIFETRGEAAFRDLEAKVLASFLANRYRLRLDLMPLLHRQ